MVSPLLVPKLDENTAYRTNLPAKCFAKERWEHFFSKLILRFPQPGPRVTLRGTLIQIPQDARKATVCGSLSVYSLGVDVLIMRQIGVHSHEKFVAGVV